jgi:hypothetical protein
MRKWSFILFGLTALIGLIVLVGCEGDTGPTGVKGSKGRQGTTGYDPEIRPPADRVFTFAVTNATENVINGKEQIYLTFDSTARGTRDTVVANKISMPPLIDGLDGEELEWGVQKSKMPLSFLDADSALAGHADGKLKNGVVRVAYDDDNIYFQFQWQEQRITTRDKSGKEIMVADIGESREPNPLNFYYKGPSPDSTPNMQIKMVRKYYPCDSNSYVPDTSYARVRVTYYPYCLFTDEDSTGAEICGCWDLRPREGAYPKHPAPDVTYLWGLKPGGEDRLVVFFPDEADAGWRDFAFKQFFGFTNTNPEMPSNFFADVWAWGAGKTKPVGTADDWSISATGAKPDIGQAPYIDNYIASDSLPRFMNRLDPNLRTTNTPTAAIYPLWYFDTKPYSRIGWETGTDSLSAAERGQRIDCNIPGIITTVPSGSRADVYAAARFDNGFWTVEMKRARKTHNGDDVEF